MAIRIRPNGEIETDTTDEAIAIIEALRNGDGAVQRTMSHTQKQVTKPSSTRSANTAFVPEEVLTKFFGDLGQTQREMFKLLSENPEGRTSEQICDALGLERKESLGGVIRMVSVTANKHSIRLEQVIERRRFKSTWRYRLTEQMAGVIPKPVL